MSWLTNKIRDARVGTFTGNTLYELKQFSSAEMASIIVEAASFCESFRESDNPVIALALLRPCQLKSEEAYGLYWELERLLIAEQENTKQILKNAQARMGADFESELKKRMHITEMGWRLVMSRLVPLFIPSCEKYISEMSSLLRSVAEPTVKSSVELLKNMNSSVGNYKTGDFYNSVETSASLIATAFNA